jgi:hypothetical protein
MDIEFTSITKLLLSFLQDKTMQSRKQARKKVEALQTQLKQLQAELRELAHADSTKW